jgi:hypothetical protein
MSRNKRSNSTKPKGFAKSIFDFSWNNFIVKSINHGFKFKVYDEKEWIKFREFDPFLRLILWFLGLRHQKDTDSFNEMLNNIKHLVEKSGSNFTFLYLKDVRGLVIRYLSGNDTNYSGKLYIRTDRSGIPKLIPTPLRDILRKRLLIQDRKIIIGIITVLSVFRSFKTHPKVDLRSIVEPFNGENQSLDLSKLKKALEVLKFPNYKTSFKLFPVLGLLSRSPNNHISILGCELDALAYLHDPLALISLLRMMWYEKMPLMFIYYLFLIIIYSPLYLFLCFYWLEKLYLGSLSCVYDQAGKARVIGVTNWWTQISLHPLHSFIFSWLRTIPMDGMSGQKEAFDIFLSKIQKGQKLYGFDLSAATDRLPRMIQKDILSLIGYDSWSWNNLMSVSFRYRNLDIKYSVGQPMGAYSSWAMLALTHHVIVQVAYINCGGTEGLFDKYCILGDDIVIGDDNVASEYLRIMEILGVNISLYKSIISTDFTEFAKLLKGPEGIDITPVSSGLILKVLRCNYYYPVLFWDLFCKKLHSFSTFDTLFRDRSKSYLKKYRSFFLWTIVTQQYLSLKGISNVFHDEKQLKFLKKMDKIFHSYSFLLPDIIQLVEKDIMKEYKISIDRLTDFKFFNIVIKNHHFAILAHFQMYFKIGQLWFLVDWLKSLYKVWLRDTEFIRYNYPDIAIRVKRPFVYKTVLGVYTKHVDLLRSYGFPNINLNDRKAVRLSTEVQFKLWNKHKDKFNYQLFMAFYGLDVPLI